MLMPAIVSDTLSIAIIAISILLMLIRPWGSREFWWIGGGAGLLILLRLIPLKLAGHAVAKGTDVYCFLIGMMLLSELAREHGVFDWLATVAVQGARGSCSRLFTLVYGIGTVVTILMSNDATAVVLTPAILTAVRKANVKPMPYLFACAIIANAASFVLPISNPANLVVFHDGIPPLARWIISFAVPSIASIATTFVAMKWIFRRELKHTIDGEPQASALSGNGRLVIAGLSAVVGVLLLVSALRMDLGLPTLIAAVEITLLISLRSKKNPLLLAREVSWQTIALVAGLFIMVETVDNIGALKFTQAWLTWAESHGSLTGALVSGFAVAIANNVVNNLPLGLIAGSTLHAAHSSGLIANVILIGVDLGPNLSITGSLATILWLLALRREQIHTGFWAFFKVGVIVMPISLITSIAAVLLLHRFGI
jgi:arsenical pump membrane protein